MVELFKVLPPAEALELHLAHIDRQTEVEEVSTFDALRRVLAEDVAAPEDLPKFRRSTVDGFGVRAQDTFGASEGLPAYLTVIGEVAMGRAPTLTTGVGEAANVHTGGMLPSGADAVVMVEYTQGAGGEAIEVLRPVAPGENVIQIGEDVRAGIPILRAGEVLSPEDLGGLIAQGILRVRVHRKPRVALVATGDEVVPPERTPELGQVRDINTYTLAARVTEAGGIPVPMGIIPDQYEALGDAAKRARAAADIVVFCAGSSVSVRDMTAQVIETLGRPGVLVHGVSLKPGKPTILAVADGTPVFGLPGNPVSAIVTFELFVVPVMARMMRMPAPVRRTVAARLTKNVSSIAGREDYVPARLIRQGEEMLAEPIFGKSNLIFSLVQADGLICVPLDKGGLAAGETVAVQLL